MSLYREVGRSRPWIVATAVVGALAIGFGAGFATGRSTAPEPTLEDAVAGLQREIRGATDALELVTIEYEQAVVNGAVAAQSEYDAARADADRAQEIFTSHRDELALLSPDEIAATETALQTLTEQIEALAEPSEVTATAEDAMQALRSAARLG
jgi:protein subunit release factor A